MNPTKEHYYRNRSLNTPEERYQQKPPDVNFSQGNGQFLYTLKAIGRWIGKNPQTVYRWIKYYGFPATKAPDGTWFTHKSLVLLWITKGHQAYLETQDVASMLENKQVDEIARRLGLPPEELHSLMEKHSSDE